MKKLTALLLSLLMLIPMLSICISAETTSLDDSLVVHYDFKGNDKNEAYKNKANGGTTQATGKLSDAQREMTWDSENGTLAYLGIATDGSAPYISKDYLSTYIGGEKEFTIFTRFKFDESVSANSAETGFVQYQLLNMNKTSNQTIFVNFTDNGTSSYDFFAVTVNGKEHRFSGITLEEVKANFVNAAIVISKKADGMYVKMYASMAGLGAECQWIELTERRQSGASLGAAIPDPGMHMYLIAQNRKAGVVMDDFRIYSKSVSTSELATIVTTGSFAELGINDYLALHYDFEGENYLENKAPYALKGDLEKSTNDVIDHDETIGTVTKTDTNNGGLYCSKNDVYDLIAGGLYNATTNTEGKAVEYTMFTRFRLDDMIADTEYRIVDARTFGSNNCRPLNVTYKNGTLMLGIGTAQGHNTANSQKTIKIAELDMETRFVNLALVVCNAASTGDTAKMKMAIYYSQGTPTSASDWKKAYDVNIVDSSSNQSSTISPLNQNLYLLDMSTGKAGVEMDDFRVYSKALTADEVYSIMDYGSFAPDVVSIGHQHMTGTDSFDVRFVGGINSTDYDEVGIEIITTVGNVTASTPTVETAKTVYSSIIADETTVNASDRYCEHLVAFVATGIPTDGDAAIQFKYRFFATKDGTTYYSEYSTASYNADGTPVA